MPCRACALSVLSVFLRQVVGVDLPIATRLPSSRHRLTTSSSTRAIGTRAVVDTTSHTPSAHDQPVTRSNREENDVATDEVDPSRKREVSDVGKRKPSSSKIDPSPHIESHLQRLRKWQQKLEAMKTGSYEPKEQRRTHDERLRSWKEQNQRIVAKNGLAEEDENNDADELATAPRTTSTRKSSSRQSPETISPKVRAQKASAPPSKPAQAATTPSSLFQKAREREPWQIQKTALEEKFGGEAWAPHRKLSPDALEGIRAMHAQYPERFTTAVLAENFKVSAEAIRRILRSKWRPSGEEAEDRRERWEKRGVKIWTQLAERGEHPPKKWREMGIGAGGPRTGRREWLQNVRERDVAEGRQRPPVIATRAPSSRLSDDSRRPRSDSTSLASRFD